MRGNLIMDHTAAVRDKMTERYLLKPNLIPTFGTNSKSTTLTARNAPWT